MLVLGLGLIALIACIAMWLVAVYNTLVQLRTNVKESASDIETLLKKRFDLIPNLVSVVKGYAKHEKEVFERITELRSQMGNAAGIEEMSQINNQMTSALKTLFAVSENYPELKANESFLKLQVDLGELETEIQKSRRFYNANVREYNVKLEIFPNVLVASYMNFKPAEFFAADEEEKKNVKVEF
ncbi:MAG: LemA family protein [Candidatus Dojkabacteria bacterium]|nr:MAG: LemA family protein [Candidatus Dojkabacteria bacterium]